MSTADRARALSVSEHSTADGRSDKHKYLAAKLPLDMRIPLYHVFPIYSIMERIVYNFTTKK